MDEPFVSVIMRSFNEGWALRETLPALRAQDYANYELIVIDSGSTDGSAELIREAKPRHLVRIEARDYNPSRVMNHGMELSQAEIGIFLNADATPQGSAWLRPLVMALQDPQTAAAFGRQIPRPDCRAVYALDYERCFGARRASSTWEHFFSMVSSGLRKDIWSKRGFLEKMQYSEDDEYTRWCRAQGYRIAYCPESVVMHSHNYTSEQAYRRRFGEARALAAVWNGRLNDLDWPRTVLLGWFVIYAATFFSAPDAADGASCPTPQIFAGNNAARSLLVSGTAGNFIGMSNRFTIDGSDALENHLARICERVWSGAQTIIPATSLEALVLGGGYGRGEGGVWKTEAGDRPYNDMEFYVFVRGNALWNERKYRGSLVELGERLSPEAGLHVEFKVDSLRRLRRSPVSMFSYDLAAGHRVVSRNGAVFRPGAHHLEAGHIPLSEATRLLFNRCSGLLLARELLRQPLLTPPQADFVARNLAKARLALGDAVLAAFGQYHWSCRERHRRLAHLAGAESLPWLDDVRNYHAAGVEFKLHPRPVPRPSAVFAQEHKELSALALTIWLWLESRRLAFPFASARDYAFSGDEKCPGNSFWRNYLSNLRAFGFRSALDSLAGRYPRERLFNALALLLWNDESSSEPNVMLRLQKLLPNATSDRGGFVRAYEEVWPAYG